MLSFRQFLNEDEGLTTTSNIVGGNPFLFHNVAKRRQLQEDTYEYSSCQFIFDKYLTDWIYEYARYLIPSTDLHDNGYINEPHITVKYGLLCEDARELFSLLETELLQPTYVNILTTDVFECDDYNVIILKIQSDKLERLNRLIVDNIEVAESKYPKYNPHVTLAYLKKEVDYKQYLNKTELLQMNIPLRTFQFSNKLGNTINFN